MNRSDFRYFLITDRRKCRPHALADVVEEACSNGIRAVQLREKDLSGKALFELARKIRDITSRWDASLFINDRADIAMAVGADGVHCREKGIGPAEVKEIDNSLQAGMSVHSLESARNAEEAGADFLLYGPVYHTPSKEKYGDPQGVNRLKKVTEAVKLPVFAVGGITPDRAFSCRSAGAYGVAGISSVMGSDSIEHTVELWENKLGQL